MTLLPSYKMYFYFCYKLSKELLITSQNIKCRKQYKKLDEENDNGNEIKSLPYKIKMDLAISSLYNL